MLHLKQFDLSNTAFQLLWLKVSLPRATKYICTLYHSPNSETMNFFATTFPNQLKPSLFSLHALKSLFLVISTYTTLTGSPIPLISPTLLVGKLRSLPLLKALTQVISEPTGVPDCAGDKANSLDLFLTSNPSIYSPPTVSSPLGNSDHCLIYSTTFSLTWIGPLLHKESFTTTRLTETPFTLLLSLPLVFRLFK